MIFSGLRQAVSPFTSRGPVLTALVCGLVLPVFGQQAPSPEAAEFFEKRIRPVLATQCYVCHGAKAPAAQGGLLLDTRDGLLKGGNSGPMVAAGNPEASLLIRALRGLDQSLKMPPGKPLPAERIADFEEWIRMGAPVPEEAQTAAAGKRKDREFWSFKKPIMPALPEVRNPGWVRAPVDRFILAVLESKGMLPSPEADKRTLIRRVTYDLTGLPPSPEEVEAFQQDQSPNAYEELVDRLLASAQHGGRWGRHWLDIARYADSQSDGNRFPFSYTYRDWVIQALNDDMPYDRFLRYQIAADLLPESDPMHLAALGFITLGREFPNSPQETIDDRVDVVTRGTQGLTVSCARCHDHKYDPIATRDYYALYGVMANVREPETLPVISNEKKTGGPLDRFYEDMLRQRREAIERYRRERYAVLMKELRTGETVATYMAAAHEARHLGNSELETMAKEWDLNLFLLRRWRDFLNAPDRKTSSVFALWTALTGVPETRFGADAPAIIARLSDPDNSINPLIATEFRNQPPATLAEAAKLYGNVAGRFITETPLARAEEEQVRWMLYGEGAPMNIAFEDLPHIETEGDRNNLRDLRLRVHRALVDYAYRGSPPRAQGLEDLPEPEPSYIFVRGNPNNKGAAVERRFLPVLCDDEPEPFRKGSGRLELADSIASSENPLTARVMVNRVWMHHFGAGLVRTPSDFGTRGDLPTHPELLDYLAVRFMEEGWSIKKLHRWIVLSSAYRQSSEPRAEYQERDPENTLLWRMNRRRLDFEMMRDGMLAVAGRLDTTLGGTPVSLTAHPATTRRAIYGFIDRARPAGVLTAFDFANPEQHSPQRFLTTAPQQALFLMNSPFIAEQARHVTARPDVAGAGQPERRIRALYRVLFSRAPSEKEIAAGLRFLTGHEQPEAASSRESLWEYGTAALADGTIHQFTPFRYYTGDAWQNASLLPDVKSGNARLTAQGGEAGDDPARVVVRRWAAPEKGTLSISGTLRHRKSKYETGDGIKAWIISARLGELASWKVWGTEADTGLRNIEVEPGDIIDFAVSGLQDSENDAFAWAPEIAMGDRKWSAAADFAGPAAAPLNAWEQYAQVLLQTNEFFFVE